MSTLNSVPEAPKNNNRVFAYLKKCGNVLNDLVDTILIPLVVALGVASLVVLAIDALLTVIKVFI